MFGFLHLLAFFAVLRSNPLGRNSERCMVGEYACPLYRSVNGLGKYYVGPVGPVGTVGR